jgi:DNA (cytosine-5)-methyltransferase 1
MSFNRSIRRALGRAQRKLPSPFNPRRVIEAPSHVIEIPPARTGGFGFIVRAHQLADGPWIAEAEWNAQSEHLPGDGVYPHRDSKRFQALSEAIDDALSRALRSIREQLGAKSEEEHWARQIAAASASIRDELATVRAQDTSLPLYGMTFADIGAGGQGGFAAALKRLGALCMLACEIDKKALDTYSAHAQPAATHDDLCTLNGKGLHVDILVMGLQCQSFSPAGKRLGMADPVRAAVYRHSLRLLREIDAKVVMIECARQLLNQDGGQDAAEVRKVLMLAGFRVQHRALNAADFGVPQDRERAFIVATRIGAAVNDVLGVCFPEGNGAPASVAEILEPHRHGHIAASRIKSTTEKRPHLRRPHRVGLIDGKNCQGYRVYDTQGVGPTLCAGSGGACPQTGAYLIGNRARGLSAREAYRMQGMPEWIDHHDNQREALKHAGNGVAVPVVREIARAIAAQISF